MAAIATSTDPVKAMLDAETAQDHAKAKGRGVRVLGLALSLASALNAAGLLRGSTADAAAEMFHPIADELYGSAAIDVPTLRRSL